MTGYKLYQEGVFACETHEPTATSMDCAVTLATATTNFTLTATFNDGTESPHSIPFAFSTIDNTTTPELPVTDTTTGSKLFTFSWETPVADLAVLKGYKIYLNNTLLCETNNPASTSITCKADLIQGTMTFGMTQVANDGTESTISNLLVFDPTAYPELFNTKLVTFNWEYSGTTDITGFRIYQDNNLVCQTTDPTVRQLACTVDINSSTESYGLTTVNTDGTESNISNLLTYTESPIDSTAAPVVQPLPPTAVISSSTAAGPAPLVVNFDASDSKAADGATIASYFWSFGDGSSTTGKTASHSFNAVGTYSTTLTVIDSKGASNSISTPIVVDSAIATTISPPEEEQATNSNIEMGEVTVTDEWGQVTFPTAFQNPVVIAGPPTADDSQPCVVRLRNVTPNGFEIRLAEWDYMDGTHPAETVSYLVMEKGRTTLPNGSIVEAGTFTGATTNQNIKYSAPFNKIPVVITTIASDNETDTISGRLSKITTSSFAYYFKEQEKNKNIHAKETVNFIAWEPGMGMIGTLQFEVAQTAAGLTDAWSLIPFQWTFQQPPLFLADMQTNNNTDTSTLRTANITETGVQVKVEEEQSKDNETSHPEETVGYILLDQEE